MAGPPRQLATFEESSLSNESTHFTLSHYDAGALANLCGQYDEHIKLIEKRLSVKISNRGVEFQVSGEPALLGPGRQPTAPAIPRSLQRRNFDP